MDLDRDNWNFTATHAWTVSTTSLNQLSVQAGRRKFDEPNNSTDVTRSFSAATTLTTGANIVGDQTDTGDILEVRDTFFTRIGSGKWAQDLKFGGAWQYVKDDWNFPVYPKGLLIYVTATRAVPLLYVGTTGSGQSKLTTNIISGFIQDDLRPSPRLTINLGLRYDLDTGGNNPDYTDPLMTTARGNDANNFQPRAGFSWDITGDGRHVMRGGVGMFTVLVVDDEEIVRNVCTAMVRAFGMQVLTASDGREAVEVFRQNADRISHVILDLTMPNMDGMAAFKEMVRIRSGVKVILCSGYDEQDSVHRLSGQGLAGFIQKPYSLAKLRDALERAGGAAG